MFLDFLEFSGMKKLNKIKLEKVIKILEKFKEKFNLKIHQIQKNFSIKAIFPKC